MQLSGGALIGGLLVATLPGSMLLAGDLVLAHPSGPGIDQEVPGSPPVVLALLPSTVALTAGFAELLRVEGTVSTIVLGNPSVADASPLDANTILLTGLAAGTTNMIVLDESGGVIADLMLQVSGRQPGTVTVRRGVETEAYSCTSGICDGSRSQAADEASTAADPLSPGAGEASPAAEPLSSAGSE